MVELLESRGFTVFLVNARHVKNVSGRKSDVLDCQWLQQLMSYGLLQGTFRPTDELCVLRALSLGSQARHAAYAKSADTDEYPARQAPKFDLRTRLFKMCGVDLTRIDGIHVTRQR